MMKKKKNMMLFRGKKAQYAIPFAMAWIFFNVLLNIMIYAFGQDSITIGTAGSMTTEYGNSSTASDIDVSEGAGFISSYRAGVSGLPWWLIIIFFMIDVVFLALIVYALIRGI